MLDNSASNGFLSTSGNQIVDANGNAVRITGINWFGFETGNKVFHGLWTRGYTSVLDQVKTLGFNTLRVPFSNEMLRSDAVTSSINFAQNPDLQGLTPIQCLDKMVEYCGKIGLRVIFDRHSAKADGYLNEDVWYIPNDAYYTEQRWVDDWSMLAKRYANNPTVIGADLFNEPKRSATWGNSSAATDWNKAAERAGNAILAANPNWLIIVEGVEKFNNETN
jgi:aryl-phospho-beta-D-glucosidase BglC (GH1 family)